MADDLDARLVEAHGHGDPCLLARLYEKAALAADHEARPEAAGFLMTQAYVFALEAGSDATGRLRAWLVERKRENEE